MVRMFLSVDGETFLKYRKQIGTWLFTTKVPLEIVIHPHRNRVTLLFQKTKHAGEFVEHFEGL